MFRRTWTEELLALAVITVVLLAVLLVTGAPLWLLALVPAVYVTRLVLEMRRVLTWAEEPRDPPPESSGIAGHAAHLIVEQIRREAQIKATYEGLIEQLEVVLHALPDAVVMLDRRMRIERANQAAARLLGVRPDDDRGQLIDNLIRHPEFVRYRRAGRHDRSISIPSPVLRERMLGVQVVACGKTHWLLVAWDETESLRLEKMRSDFISNVSHELRTPLTVLRGYLETMTESASALPERWHRPVAAMADQVERMSRLTEDLLLLARVESTDRPPETSRVPIAKLAQRLHEEAVALSGARAHRVSYEADPGVDLLGNEHELHTAFSNLVANAVRYTPAGGAIHIRWSRDAQGACFEVVDAGEGIDAPHLPRLTERFYRADPGRSGAQGGTGLGLAIVKHVLGHYDARLVIESEVGKGSRFACRFPESSLLPAGLEREEG